MVKTNKLSEKIANVIIYLVLILAALLCLLPILNTVAISFSDKSAAMAGQVMFWPVNFTTASYKAILEDQQFLVSFCNSVKRVVLGVSINMVISILMAYPLSKNKKVFRQRNIYMWFVIFTMLFSGGLVPTFLLVNRLKLVDTIWALVLPGAVPVFNIIVLMNFMKGLPEEIEEAARIDGASAWKVLIKIVVPLSKASLATIMLFSIVNHWNAFFDGIIYINSSAKLPLQTYIQQLVVEIRDMSMMTPEEIQRVNEISSRTFNAAKVFVTMVPVLCVYPFLQKYFVTGLVVGSVKG